MHPDGEVSLREVAAALDDGTWRDRPRIKRFLVIGGGVLVMLVAAAALGIVAAPPGIELIVILAALYVIVRAAWPRTRSPRAPRAGAR